MISYGDTFIACAKRVTAVSEVWQHSRKAATFNNLKDEYGIRECYVLIVGCPWL